MRNDVRGVASASPPTQRLGGAVRAQPVVRISAPVFGLAMFRRGRKRYPAAVYSQTRRLPLEGNAQSLLPHSKGFAARSLEDHRLLSSRLRCQT